MLHIYPFDILSLSETCLKGNKHLLKHVQILGYKFSYRNKNKGQGGVGLCIKDSIEYKVFHVLNAIDETTEDMWIE